MYTANLVYNYRYQNPYATLRAVPETSPILVPREALLQAAIETADLAAAALEDVAADAIDSLEPDRYSLAIDALVDIRARARIIRCALSRGEHVVCGD